MTKSIKVAAIQMSCLVGDVDQNLAHAEQLIIHALSKEAKLILLPELMPGGYTLTEAIWDSAETIDGKSVTWLKKTAKRYNIYLGFSFLEADGEDFYNTFVLADPEGKLLGRVRKTPPSSVEAYFYKAGSDEHVIETDIGRIGIGICYENTLYDHICYLHEAKIDFLLSPSAAGRPMPIIPGDIKRFEKMLIKSREVYAKTLGIPVVMANHSGSLETELPGNLPDLKSSFPGLSSIVDYDGTVKAELGDEEGVIIAEVQIGHDIKRKTTPKKYGSMWAIPAPWYAFIWPMTQKWGEKSYQNNQRRKESAIEVSSNSSKSSERNI